MRRLGIAVMVFAVFAGIIRAEEETAAPLAPPNYYYFEYAADSNKYLKDWTKFLSAVMAQKAEGAPEFTFVSIYDAGLPTYMGSFTDLILIGRKGTAFKFSGKAKDFLSKYYPELTNYQFPENQKSQPIIGVLPDNKIVIHSIYFAMVDSDRNTLNLYPNEDFNINVGPSLSIGSTVFGITATLFQNYNSSLNGIIVSLNHDAVEFNGIAAGLVNRAEFSRFCAMQAGLSNYLGNSNGVNFQAGVNNHANRSGGVNLQFGLNNECDLSNGFSLQAGVANSADGEGFGIQIGLLNDNGVFYMPIINIVF